MENQISIEEMKVAVIAECKCLCPKSNDIHWLDNVGRNYLFRESDDVWMLNCVDNVFSIIAHDDNPSIWLYTYRLLGLESRAKDAEIARLQSEMSILQGERRIAEYFSLPKTIEDLEPFLLTLLSSHSIRVSEGVRAIRNAFDELTSVKDAEIHRLRAALSEIAELEFDPLSDPNDIGQEYRHIAQNALKGGTND